MSKIKTQTQTQINSTFDLTAAIEAAAHTAPATRSGAQSELSANIVKVLEGAGIPLAINQIKAALVAGGMNVTGKQISDRVWLLERQGKASKVDKGVYARAGYTNDAQ